MRQPRYLSCVMVNASSSYRPSFLFCKVSFRPPGLLGVLSRSECRAASTLVPQLDKRQWHKRCPWLSQGSVLSALTTLSLPDASQSTCYCRRPSLLNCPDHLSNSREKELVLREKTSPLPPEPVAPKQHTQTHPSKDPQGFVKEC